MVKNLRQKPETTFEQLIVRTAQTLTNLGYKQEPQIIGAGGHCEEADPGVPAPQEEEARGRSA